MKAEWEALQNNPSAVDEQIRAQLDMLESINNNAFEAEATGVDGEKKINPSEIGKMMQDMMKKQRTQADGGASITVEYRSKGDAFQDP